MAAELNTPSGGGRLLTSEALPSIQAALAETAVDGWLIFDFHGCNPIAGGLLALEGLVTRRVFVFIPRRGAPTAITHAIEQAPWASWPAEWPRVVYSGWRELEAAVATLVGGKQVAMEYSPGDAVPYVDRVPAGVLEMVRAAGATVVSSGELVSRFYAALSDDARAAQRRAAEAIAMIAEQAFVLAGERSRSGGPITEFELQRWILERIERAGLEAGEAPIIGIGPNAANPHYGPSATPAVPIRRGDVLLIDLWGRETGQPFADQTWMGSLGDPASSVVGVWEAVRDARDAAVSLVRSHVPAGRPLHGAEVDDAARAVIEARGLGKFFIHRTGHSLDRRDIHGSGPHIDNLETRDDRLLVAGVAFTIEPGVYQTGVLGVRSEVNVLIGPGASVDVTPARIQRDLIVV